MKPNILLIVIDSLRYDKCYGETKTSLTPNLDKIIDNAVNTTHIKKQITNSKPHSRWFKLVISFLL